MILDIPHGTRPTNDAVAILPAELQRLFREAIDRVMDIEAFNAELDAERKDAAFLDEARQRVHASMRGIVSDGGPDDA